MIAGTSVSGVCRNVGGERKTYWIRISSPFEKVAP